MYINFSYSKKNCFTSAKQVPSTLLFSVFNIKCYLLRQDCQCHWNLQKGKTLVNTFTFLHCHSFMHYKCAQRNTNTDTPIFPATHM